MAIHRIHSAAGVVEVLDAEDLALRDDGLGFINVGKLLKRNKNTIGKIVGSAASLIPGVGGLVAQPLQQLTTGFLASGGGGGGAAGDPMAMLLQMLQQQAGGLVQQAIGNVVPQTSSAAQQPAAPKHRYADLWKQHVYWQAAARNAEARRAGQALPHPTLPSSWQFVATGTPPRDDAAWESQLLRAIDHWRQRALAAGHREGSPASAAVGGGGNAAIIAAVLVGGVILLAAGGKR